MPRPNSTPASGRSCSRRAHGRLPQWRLRLIISGEWPDPVVTLDNRDLAPPEPMVRILAAGENLSPGETLSALLRREPVFLFRELEKRGHHWRGGFTPDGSTYELTVRVSS